MKEVKKHMYVNTVIEAMVQWLNMGDGEPNIVIDSVEIGGKRYRVRVGGTMTIYYTDRGVEKEVK